jgi:hypothetical protein
MNYLVFFVLGAIVIAATLYSLRREHIRVEYSVSWLAVGCALAFLALFPGVLRAAASALSLDPQVCFVLTGGILISILVFEISRVVSRIRDDNVTLAQRVAILEFHLNSARREQQSRGD